MDELHFLYEIDTLKMLSIRGDQDVNYHDFVFGTEKITIVLRISKVPNSKIKVLPLFLRIAGEVIQFADVLIMLKEYPIGHCQVDG